MNRLLITLLAIRLLLSNPEDKRPLEKKSYFEKDAERSKSINWFPQTPEGLKEDNFFLKKCDSGPLANIPIPTKGRTFGDFSWTSLVQFKGVEKDTSYVLIGGSQKTPPGSSNYSVILENSYLLLCKIKIDASQPFGVNFNPEDCLELPEEKDPNFVNLGASVDQIQTQQGDFIVYCDPLYKEGDSLPDGRCYGRYLEKNIETKILHNQCKKNEKCMSGFSLALDELDGRIRVWSGTPLGNHRGVLQVNSIGKNSGESLETSANLGSYTGYSVVPGYVSSPANGNWTDYSKPVVRLTKVKAGLNDVVGGSHYELPSDQDFTGFGTAMIQASFLNNIGNATVVGAPYANSFGVNSGRIYLYCDNKVQKTYNDFLDGYSPNGYFGYSLSNMGYIHENILIAVGEPHLANSTQNGQGRIFLIKINDDCTFDREPLQVVESGEDNKLFGYLLPKKGSDIDQNNSNDLIVPVRKEESGLPTTDVFFSKKQMNMVCIMNTMKIKDFSKGTVLKIDIDLHGRSNEETIEYQEFFKRIFDNLKNPEDLFVHQIDPDSNVTEPRFKIEKEPFFRRDSDSKIMTISAELIALMSNEEMEGIDNGEKPLIVKYRFLEKCNDDKCKDGKWTQSSYIDWSQCQAKINITRFHCFDKDGECPCKTDVIMTAEDHLSDMSFSSTDSIETQTSQNPSFIYGKSTERNITISVQNNGPHNAKYVKLFIESYGNMKLASIDKDHISTATDDNKKINVTIGELGYTSDTEREDLIKAGVINEVKLMVFYDSQDANFTTDSGVRIKVETGTPDPNMENNLIDMKYKVVNKPEILIQASQEFSSNIMDNRTEPTNTFNSRHKKEHVSEIGPNLKHPYKIEYLGPSKELKNVEVRIKVPVMLPRPYLAMPYDAKDVHLFYLFKYIKRETSEGMEKENLIPKIIRTDPNTNEVEVLSECTYDLAAINPRDLIPGELADDRSNSRIRRSATIYIDDDKHNHEEGPFRESFQRTPRETFQCGRRGISYEEPICTEFVCKIPTLAKSRPVEVSIDGWLWSRTFFKEVIPDIVMATTVDVSQGYVPEGVEKAPEPAGTHSLRQNIHFPQIKTKYFHHTPIWPIVVGICAGMTILGILAAILYRIGFFKRIKRREHLRRARMDRGLPPDTNERVPLYAAGPSEPAHHWHDNPLNSDIQDEETQPIHSGLGPQTNPEKEKKLRQQKIKDRDKISIVHPADMSPLM